MLLSPLSFAAGFASIHAMKSPSPYLIFAWLASACVLFVILALHLLPALLAGLLVYAVVGMMTPRIAYHFSPVSQHAKLMAVGIVVIVVVSMLGFAGVGLVAFFRSDMGSLQTLLAKMAEIVADTRKNAPSALLQYLPADALAFEEAATTWLRVHAEMLQVVGKEAIRTSAHIFIGLILGGMLALHEAVSVGDTKPLARALSQRVALISRAFNNIVFAQIRIAIINATVTGVYLTVVLPMLDIDLPLVKTMIAITFVVGLIPVLGNLISNTVIVVVSLSHSFIVAIGSLVFLVVIHKLEYFLNARIVGEQIRASAWEILTAMLVMEAAFGLNGIIAAPIYYAYLKSELRACNLV